MLEKLRFPFCFGDSLLCDRSLLRFCWFSFLELCFGDFSLLVCGFGVLSLPERGVGDFSLLVCGLGDKSLLEWGWGESLLVVG